jgi:hypothetical protein
VKAAPAALLCGILTTACVPRRTEVVLSVNDYDLVVPRDLDSIRIKVTGGGQTFFDSQPLPLCADSGASSAGCYFFPITLTLFPGQQMPSAPVRVEVDALIANRTASAGSALFTFTPGISQRLDFDLFASCLGVDCTATGQACAQNGTCQTLMLAPLVQASAADLGAPDGALGPSCPSSALFCDDFESESIAQWSDHEGQLSIDQARVWRGTHSLMAEDPGADGGVTASDLRKHQLPLSAATIATRGYFYVASPLETVTVFYLTTSLNQGVYLTASPSELRVGLEDPGATVPPSVNGLKLDRWVCLELVLQIGTSGRVQAYADGTPVIDFATNTVPAAAYENFIVGMVGPIAPDPFQLWMDDVAVGTQRIGCE